jgi:hypothetical protein
MFGLLWSFFAHLLLPQRYPCASFSFCFLIVILHFFYLFCTITVVLDRYGSIALGGHRIKSFPLRYPPLIPSFGYGFPLWAGFRLIFGLRYGLIPFRWDDLAVENYTLTVLSITLAILPIFMLSSSAISPLSVTVRHMQKGHPSYTCAFAAVAAFAASPVPCVAHMACETLTWEDLPHIGLRRHELQLSFAAIFLLCYHILFFSARHPQQRGPHAKHYAVSSESQPAHLWRAASSQSPKYRHRPIRRLHVHV